MKMRAIYKNPYPKGTSHNIKFPFKSNFFNHFSTNMKLRKYAESKFSNYASKKNR